MNAQAFSVLHAIVRARLELGKLTVIDATNVQAESRGSLIDLARSADLFATAIVLDVPPWVCDARNAGRPDRQFGRHVVRGQADHLRRSIRNLRYEGFKHLYVIDPEKIAEARIQRTPLWTDRRSESGPFDIIGDVHGCFDELSELFEALGYRRNERGVHVHRAGRRAIFLGDLVDRGPNSVGVLDLTRRMVAAGAAFCVPGNHDEKLLKKLSGKDVRITHGLAETLEQIDAIAPEDQARFVAETTAFLDGLVSHFVLDGGRLVVAHAGMKAEYQGRSSRRVREFALYGETTGETDEFGLSVRYRWAEDYRGKALVVYGHTPVHEPDRLNNTMNIDTGCAFGGKLTALRYPENELVSIPAKRIYADPVRPFLTEPAIEAGRAGRPVEGLLRIEDVVG